MYFPINYNCFVNQLYCKTKIVYKKGATCKKKYANFIFALGIKGGRLQKIMIYNNTRTMYFKIYLITCLY